MGKDSIDRGLRSAAPKADEEFVSALAAEIPVAPRRRSRAAFATAIAVLVLGTFASFGGVGYAAENASKAAGAAKAAVTSATDQYGNTTPVPAPPPVNEEQVAGTSAAAEEQPTLPFTGLSLIGTVCLGAAMLAVGLVLRRRERSDES